MDLITNLLWLIDMSTLAPIHLWQIPTSTPTDHEQLQPLINALESHLHTWAQRFSRITQAHSLAVEDMVITDALARLGLAIDVFVLDTGKLHAESLAYLDSIRQRYPTVSIRRFTPQDSVLQHFAETHDFSDIYQSLSARKACCYARKIEPLQRALTDYEAWITGQRREQASTRTQLEIEEFDAAHQLHKFNPLATWSQQHIWAYIQQHQLPINLLYTQGIPSIGCEPCTKPIRQGEALRAGRWWWENQTSKECGLHAN